MKIAKSQKFTDKSELILQMNNQLKALGEFSFKNRKIKEEMKDEARIY